MLLGFPSIYLWVAILILSIAIEGFTLTLTSIWFAVGALASLIAASFGLNIMWQLIVFAIVSALLLALMRPFTQKFLRVRGEKTNADRIIDQLAIVTAEIDNMMSQGEIVLMGQYWTARSADNLKIAVGTKVRVLAIMGVKAIVEVAASKEEPPKDEEG